MKTSLVILAALALAGAAHATQPGNNGNGQGGCGQGQTTNGCPGGSTGGAGGAGGSATSVSGAAAIAGAAAGAVSGSQSAVVGSGNSTATGGAGGAGGSSRADGGQASAVGSVTVNGDTYQAPAQAATAYAPSIPQVATSCRLYISLGGAGSNTATTASVSGGIPIGNDQTCLVGNQLRVMTAINDADKTAGRPATFSPADFRAAACSLEGMSEMSGCKAPSQTRAEAILNGQSVALADPALR